MIIRQFLQWTASAPADARAQGAAALACAYVDGEFDAAERADAEAVMAALLDDPSPAVRLAMAEKLAPSPDAPPALITALASDQAAIARLVLQQSPVLTSAELVDAMAVGQPAVQVAIAERARIDVGLAAAIAEVGGLESCVALCRNTGAALTAAALARMLARFGAEPDLRQAMAGRHSLPAGLRVDLVREVASSLQSFVVGCEWLSGDRASRLVRDATDQACLTIAADTAAAGDVEDVVLMVRHLRASGCLTPALLLRAALSGSMALFEAALSELSGLPLRRVSGLVAHGAGLGFSSLYTRAGLPMALRPAFEAALGRGDGARIGDAPQRARITRALAACAQADGPALGTVTALLRRLDSEAARAEARAFARDLAPDASVMRLPRLTAHDRSLPSAA